MISKGNLSHHVSPKIILACLFMFSSALLRVYAYLRFAVEITAFDWIFYITLPVVSCLLFVLFSLSGSVYTEKLLCIPVLLGILFFIVKATGFVWWHQILCTILYCLVFLLFTLTAFHKIHSRIPVILVFLLPLLFHLLDDIIRYVQTVDHNPLEWLLEITVLLVMAALLLFSVDCKQQNADKK